MVDRVSRNAAEATEAPREPYVKPGIAWEESVEEQSRLMSACGKLAGSGACDGVEEAS